MNKKLFFGLGMVSLVAVGLVSATQKASDNVSDQVLSNVEALSRWEVSVEYDKSCVNGGDVCITDGQSVYFNAEGRS